MEIPAIAGRQFGVFTFAQARGNGVSRSAIAYAASRDRIVCLRRGVYASAETMAGSSPLDRHRQFAAHSAAAALTQTGSAASHRSAAVLARQPVLTLPPRPSVTLSPRSRADASGLDVHRARLVRPDDVVAMGSIERTASCRTVVDVAREVGVDEAVVIADAAIRTGMTDLVRLNAELARCHRWPGVSRAREAVARCQGSSESPLESISRLRLQDVGLPTPTLQPEIVDVSGRFLARSDFYWDSYGVVGEADGVGKYTEVEVLRLEKRRQERLEETGLIVVRWGWAELDDLSRLVDRIRRAFARGAARPAEERRWLCR